MPRIKSPTDTLLRGTSSGVCSCDLHMYDRRTPLAPGSIAGHEIVEVIFGHHVQVDQAPKAYEKFDPRTESFIRLGDKAA
jgi:D-arabinose 1-dehydrogenase-like Zn-dependent alcohol dehydrogenase